MEQTVEFLLNFRCVALFNAYNNIEQITTTAKRQNEITTL
jgi:hypothetical protein